jgi:hypothetical protein
MTISIPLVFNLPHLIVFIAMIPVIFLTALGSYHFGRNVEIRSNEYAVRKATAQMLQAPWYVTGEADRIERPNPDITLYRVNPYRREDDEDLALAA